MTFRLHIRLHEILCVLHRLTNQVGVQRNDEDTCIWHSALMQLNSRAVQGYVSPYLGKKEALFPMEVCYISNI